MGHRIDSEIMKMPSTQTQNDRKTIPKVRRGRTGQTRRVVSRLIAERAKERGEARHKPGQLLLLVHSGAVWVRGGLLTLSLPLVSTIAAKRLAFC